MHDGETLALTPGGGLLGADAVFPVLHGPFGEDGTVQGLLELLDVPYVGAGVLASSLCMDKVVFKEVLAAAGVPQVASLAVREHRWRDERDAVRAELAVLGTPVFVKPARLGSSVGIAKAWGEADLDAALDGALRARQPRDRRGVLRRHRGRVLGARATRRPEASVPGEIVVLKGDWYDYEAKYSDGGMELIVPARLPDAVTEQVRALAVDTFVRVGCAGLARVDFFVEGDRVLVNELNTMPGFTGTSAYPKLWEATGIPARRAVRPPASARARALRRERAGHASSAIVPSARTGRARRSRRAGCSAAAR